jgi:N4-gp56 family major capsid protein
MPGPTNIAFGSPQAVKKWSGKLFYDLFNKTYFKRMSSEGQNGIIQRLTDLESDAGDTITFDLSVQLKGPPTSGDARLEGSEENLIFYNDNLFINQLRKAVSAGGKMARKRTLHNTRSIANDLLSDYWAKYFDEMLFIYLSGHRGINEDYTETVAYAGHAANPIQAPDAAHIIFAGAATSKATMAATDKMTKTVIERAATKATMMRAVDPTLVNMQPLMINGAPHFAMVMNPFQLHDLRTADTIGWIDIQKAAAAAEGQKNAIFTGNTGMINNIVLHSHQSAIRFSDYGAGANVAAGRALLLGKQAGVVAYGSSGGLRMSWKEEMKDYDNEPTVAAGTIMGVKKTRFNSTDFGVMSIDTASANPN